MSPEKQALLFDRYPDIFRERNLPMTETCMCWGLEMGDGWFQIMDNLCAQLTLLKRYTGVEVVFDQTKAKFATLRVYWHIETFPIASTDEERIRWDTVISGLVEAAEHRSSHTCEVTGAYGSLHVRGGWYKTLCEDEAKKQGYMTIDDWRKWCAQRDLEKRAEVEGL